VNSSKHITKRERGIISRLEIDIDKLKSTKDIKIPKDPLKRVIGQDNAIEIARVAANQRRHLLLVGPPGTGKSMIAQAISLHLRAPTEEIQIVQNPENPERPFVQIKNAKEIENELKLHKTASGELIDPSQAPMNVAEQLGYRCVSCGKISSNKDLECPKCGTPKTTPTKQKIGNPFGDLMGVIELTISQLGGETGKKNRVKTTRVKNGKEEVVVYEPAGEKIKLLDQKALEKQRIFERQSPRKVLVPLDRNPFVMATGASETELLGDVRHDPYGGHPQLGTQPYERVVPGAIHEAHQGVLFLDELPLLGQLQRNILTAMQEKRFPISGRHPQSAGASVRVDEVPCDFIFVGACNIQDLPNILSPLRSRINGSGYEVLVELAIKDTKENRGKFTQFIAQEINMDQRIPHADHGAILSLIGEAIRRAEAIDGFKRSLTVRLREMGGLIRTAGDLAVAERTKFIKEHHIEEAINRCKTAEEQIKEKYGSLYKGLARDVSSAQKEGFSPYNYWDSHDHDDQKGYE
jgi:ATP-dependent Lon protease